MQAKAHGRVSRLRWLGLLGGLGVVVGLAAGVAGCSLEDEEQAAAAEEAEASASPTTSSATSSVRVLADYVVTVHKNGSSGGYVYSTPSGISCGSPCSASFPAGTVLTLTAEPAAAADFGGWSGPCSGTSPTCTFIVEGDTDVGANFQQKFFTLTVGKVGYGSGTVTSSPSYINCGSTCSATVPYGYNFALTATPSAGSLFLGWSGGGCSGTGTCYVTMTQAQNVTATFVQANPVVTVVKTGSSGGSVTSSPGYISCSPTCSSAIPYGTVLTLTATPAVQAIFGGWSGACSGTSPTCTFTVTRDVTVAANFQMKFLTLSVSKSGQGVVTSSPSGINCGTACTTSVPYGYGFTLTASPAFGSVFLGWGGACSGTGSCYVSMTSNRAVTATFSP